MGDLLQWPQQEPKENPQPYTTVNALADAYVRYNQIARSEYPQEARDEEAKS